jgi:hypothetical protein
MTMQIIINWLCNNLPSPIVGVTTTAKIKQILNRIFCFEKHVAILYQIPDFLSLSRSSIVNTFPTDKTDRHKIAEILLKVAFNTITLTP